VGRPGRPLGGAGSVGRPGRPLGGAGRLGAPGRLGRLGAEAGDTHSLRPLPEAVSAPPPAGELT